MAKAAKKPDNRAGSEAVEGEAPLSSPDANLVIWTKSREESDRLVAEAQSLCWADRFDEAIALCGRAITLADDNAYAYAIRADALRLAGRLDEALADSNHSIEIAPDDAAFPYTVRATVHRKAGRLDEALADCDRAITVKPSFAFGYAVRAETHRLAGRLDDALADCETALKLKPDYGYALEFRQRVLIAIGESNKKDYLSNRMNKAAIKNKAALIKTAAELLTAVYPAEDVGKALENLAAKTPRENTTRATVKPRAKKVNRELTAVRLKATYEVLLRESDLTNPKLPNEERLRRAEHLLATYKRLRRLVPAFHDTSGELQAARSLTNSKNYQRRKAKLTAAAA